MRLETLDPPEYEYAVFVLPPEGVAHQGRVHRGDFASPLHFSGRNLHGENVYQRCGEDVPLRLRDGAYGELTDWHQGAARWRRLSADDYLFFLLVWEDWP